MIPTLIINTAALYGGNSSPYISGWLSVNFIVILIGFLAVAGIYMISRIMPTSTQSKLNQVIRAEITQLILGIVIILVLIAFATTAYDVSASMSTSVLASAGVTQGRGLSPFQYADYYIGTLAMNHGINLLGYIYSTSISYAIESRILTVLSTDLSFKPGAAGIITFTPSFDYDLGALYGTLSDVYFDVLSPILIVTIGMLFLQYLALPVLEYTAFLVILPIAIIMRLIPFGGNGLKSVANAVLAIAIAAYIIYPLMIAFDSYIMYWMYSPTLNPLYGCTNCLQTAYVLPTMPSSTFLSQPVATGQNALSSSLFGVSTPEVNTLVSSTLLSGFELPVSSIASYVVQTMSEFVFVAVFLFGLNLAVTISFAMGLARSLDIGVEGPASFWASL